MSDRETMRHGRLARACSPSWIALALILALAIWVRWPGMNRTVWEDEANSFLECRAGFGYTQAELEKLVVTSAETGFWSSFQVFKICDALKRTGSVAATRLPILALGLACIALGWRLGAIWRSRLLGFTLALLLALWPFKALWDSMVRYYAIELCLMLAQIVAAEAFRRTPEKGGPFIALAVLSLLAALSQPLAAVLILIPWIYLGWVTARQVGSMTRTRKDSSRPCPTGGDAHATRAFGARLAIQILLLGSVSFSVVLYNRGADWVLDRFSLGASAPTAPAAQQARFAGPRDLPPYFIRGIRQAFAHGQWSPAPLLGMESGSPVFAALVRGGSDGEKPLTPRAGALLLVGILAGSLALAWRSPPLLLSLWAAALSTGLILELNQKSHIIASRYYTAPALGGVILIAAGLEGALALAWIPIRRKRPAWTPRAELSAALILFLIVVPGLARQARCSARTVFQDWLGFMRDTHARHPGAVLFVGIEGKNTAFYQELAAARERGRPHPDYWASPLRHRTYDGYRQPWLQDAALLEKLNAYDAAAFFNYEYWPGEFLPFFTHRSLLPPLAASSFAGIRARSMDLGHRVFVTHGQTAILLRPRLRDEKTSNSWRLECFFEVPGVYDLTVTTPQQVRLSALNAAGRGGAYVKKPATGNWQPATLNEDWRAVPDEPLPLPKPPIHSFSARIAAPAEPTRPLEVKLVFESPVSPQQAPVLEWRLNEPPWQPLTPHYDIGRLYSWKEERGFGFGVPLRIKNPDGLRLEPRFQLVGAGGNAVLGEMVFPIEPRRGLRAGDAIFMGPYYLDDATTRRLVGKTLAMTLLPLMNDPQVSGRTTREPLLAARPLYRPLGQYCLTYLRFIEKEGKIIPQFASPPE